MTDAATEPTDTSETNDGGPADPPRRSGWRVVRRVLFSIAVALAFVVILVAIMAVWPASTDGLEAQPDPTDTYDEAVERFEQLTAGEADFVWPPCASSIRDHGERTDVAVVLFHGLTNCPEQFQELADELYAAGANVVVLRAPRHGHANRAGTGIGSVSNVAGLTPAELRDYADDAIDVAAGLGDEVRVLGLSMGGVLANWAAQFREVDRVVTVAPAMSIPRVPSMATTAFVNLFDKLPNFSLPGVSNLDHAYAGESTEGLVAMFRLSRATEHSVGDRGPLADEVVVVVNPDDDQVDAADVTGFAQRWNERDGNVAVVELPAVGLPHDVIDPDQPAGDVDLVYPLLLALLDRGAP